MIKDNFRRLASAFSRGEDLILVYRYHDDTGNLIDLRSE